MSEIEWINVASKFLGYCAQLLQQIKDLKETLQDTRGSHLTQDSGKRTAGTTWLRHSPLNWNCC